METGTGLDKLVDDAVRPRGLQVMVELTDGLCELSCTEDAQARIQFAAILAEQLGRPVDLRGVRQREDVAALVRAALNVAGGEHVLVDVVRILEGTPAGDELDRLIAPDAPVVPDLPWDAPGPLSRDDENSARAVLAKGELPASRVRDDLVEELNGLDLPIGLAPDQLLSHLLEWNTQPDGLPPAVLLMDRAARLAPPPRTAPTWSVGSTTGPPEPV
ncbi:hypothetical protein SALBM311S_01565 [Streptomyces alboniger]